jgi:dephospho-CoA kinase
MRFSTLLFPPTVTMAWVSTSQLASSFSRTSLTSLNSVRVLGVCGGIGSGKSHACKTLVEDLGCWAHLEADTIAHKVYEPHSQAVKDIAQAFGSDILTDDGQVDRKQLGAIVFSSADKMAQLERIVWPHVKTEIQTIIDYYRDIEPPDGKEPILVLEAAVLVDAGWLDLLDGMWVVQVPTEVALERLQSQRGLTAEDAQTRIEAQQTRRGIGNLQEEVDNGVVSCVITNEGSTDELKDQLGKALQHEACWYTPSS